ncbi:hypothetical protein BFN67_07130 [Pseudaminobacter manganicus]|uniref:Uncharacterized protein n=1 Tax=Manganibacter manganicus TaxID=1873176 RepID=A0A1V8RKM8_9HYPH|nr:hypothetical protein BFN67_07130 [Pseudaminobacter manganicus]
MFPLRDGHIPTMVSRMRPINQRAKAGNDRIGTAEGLFATDFFRVHDAPRMWHKNAKWPEGILNLCRLASITAAFRRYCPPEPL